MESCSSVIVILIVLFTPLAHRLVLDVVFRNVWRWRAEAVDSVAVEADSAVEADLGDLVAAACRAEAGPAAVGSEARVQWFRMRWFLKKKSRTL